MGLDYKKYTDEELVQMFDGSNKDGAFAELYKRYRSQIYSFCKDKVRNDFLMDVVQDVFMKLYDVSSRNKNITNVKAYLYKAAFNTSMNYKSKKANSEIPLDVNLHDVPTEDDSDKHNMLEILEQAVGSLSKDHQTIFTLREYEGHSFNDICDKLGISLSTAKVRAFRARNRVREILEEHISELNQT